MLSEHAFLRLTLLYWKRHLRPATCGIHFIGPNTGQISTYTLFSTLLQILPQLQPILDLRLYEMYARSVVMHVLLSQLIVRSYLARDMAQCMLLLPPIV